MASLRDAPRFDSHVFSAATMAAQGSGEVGLTEDIAGIGSMPVVAGSTPSMWAIVRRSAG